MLKLADLKARGACVDTAPVRRSVTWLHTVNGEEITDTFDVWVTRVSFGTIDRMSAAQQSERSRNAELIAASIRLGEHAEEEVTYDIAYSLHPMLALELVRAVGEVNRLKVDQDTSEEAGGPKG